MIEERAIAELLAMPEEDRLRAETLGLLISWRIAINIDDNDLDAETRELIMQLSPAYIKWREDTLQEGKAEVALNLLKSGMGYEQVLLLTGLSMELVQGLSGEVEEENS